MIAQIKQPKATELYAVQLSIPELADKINQEYELSQRSFQSALLHAKQAGEYLLEAKAKVEREQGRRKFKPWLEQNFKFSRVMAYNYMRLADSWSEIICKPGFTDTLSYKQALTLLAESKEPEDDDSDEVINAEIVQNEQPQRIPDPKPVAPAHSVQASPIVVDQPSCEQCLHCELFERSWYCHLHKQQYTPDENPAPNCEQFKEGRYYQGGADPETIEPVVLPQPSVEQAATYKPKRDRIANDYYPTPDEIINILLERVKIEGTVLEPCAGHGAIAKLFPDCITNEPFSTNDFSPDFANDATDPVFWEALDGKFDWVVTNPPYEGQAMRTILEAALVHASVGVAMLVRLSYLEPCQDRVKLLQDYADCMTHQITVSPRPQFRRDTNSSDNITSAWVVWQKDWSWAKQGIDCPFQFVAGWR